jgi:hypothetical protein
MTTVAPDTCDSAWFAHPDRRFRLTSLVPAKLRPLERTLSRGWADLYAPRSEVTSRWLRRAMPRRSVARGRPAAVMAYDMR